MRVYGTSYDIGSIMQYTPFEFSVDPTVPSMVAVNINEQGNMGQLAGPSYRDVQIMNLHYACQKLVFQTNVRSEYDVITVEFKIHADVGAVYAHLVMVEPAALVPRDHQFADVVENFTRKHYHDSPQGTRIHLTIEKVVSTCLPGCWREAAEFKVRNDKRITGNR
ncbi:unnamed protein product [Strongylus vulgaris]|uniref:Peptidase M12A domain-containing protein n=1 Tax=Strongylus vulgaris TaxID=40348 RepID=A0A3P7IJD4_STRVU|nr:unnamed protein product [Strongylus vulgaris]